MHTFILLNGKVQKWERFMQGPKLTDGCHWRNACDNVWVETRGEIETVDPNKRTLFGYEEKAFLARQYK